MFYGNRVCISSHFRDNGPQTYWGHDLDLSRWRDVIGHVTNRFAYAISYWYPIGTESLSSTVFEIFAPKPVSACAHTRSEKERDTPQLILYSVPCNVLHWTDNNFIILRTKQMQKNEHGLPMMLPTTQSSSSSHDVIIILNPDFIVTLTLGSVERLKRTLAEVSPK